MVANTVLTGKDFVGFTAFALAISPQMKEKGRYILISDTLHPPLEQSCVVVKDSKNAALAAQFKEFLTTEPARKILKSAGFEL